MNGRWRHHMKDIREIILYFSVTNATIIAIYANTYSLVVRCHDYTIG